MGDVVNFSGKKPKEANKPEMENVAAMVCGYCENVAFFLATDGRLFCTDCRHQVEAQWFFDEEQPVA